MYSLLIADLIGAKKVWVDEFFFNLGFYGMLRFIRDYSGLKLLKILIKKMIKSKIG